METTLRHARLNEPVGIRCRWAPRATLVRAPLALRSVLSVPVDDGILGLAPSNLAVGAKSSPAFSDAYSQPPFLENLEHSESLPFSGLVIRSRVRFRPERRPGTAGLSVLRVARTPALSLNLAQPVQSRPRLQRVAAPRVREDDPWRICFAWPTEAREYRNASVTRLALRRL